ncbi:MAG: hypothetical protein ABW215_16395 [Kibdelosporangium sp.]
MTRAESTKARLARLVLVFAAVAGIILLQGSLCASTTAPHACCPTDRAAVALADDAHDDTQTQTPVVTVQAAGVLGGGFSGVLRACCLMVLLAVLYVLAGPRLPELFTVRPLPVFFARVRHRHVEGPRLQQLCVLRT